MSTLAELKVHTFLQKAMHGEAHMSEEVIEQVASDVKAALHKQFNNGPRDAFRIRMSNIGRPTCQLWMEKNYPEEKSPLPPNFMINMILGDLVEAVFKGILRSAKVEFEDNGTVVLKLPNGQEIKGEYDMIMDGKVDDVKSASPWSYNNKFEDFHTLSKEDSFGYIPQLVGYAEAAGKEVGGWWVINKGTGEFKYVSADSVDRQAVLDKMQETVDYIEQDKPFERCFEAYEETHYRKKTGNKKLGVTCGFCNYKKRCWPTLRTLPAVMSNAKVKPMVDYVELAEEYEPYE